MSEHSPRSNSEPTPERKMTEAQEAAIRDLCARYGVEYKAEHYASSCSTRWLIWH